MGDAGHAVDHPQRRASGGLICNPVRIETFAGDGESIASGDGGPAVNTGLGIPRGIAIDGSGNVYVTDIDSATIRAIHAVSRKTK